MADNLLNAASIVLTPTAYDDGKVLCVKPSEPPYGDLDFSRNSSATRVNAQGLVEDVQILSGNLVTNGDFSQEGAELVTSWVNNDFTAFSSNGSDITQMVSSASGNNCYSSSAFISGKSYKLEFTSSQSITAQVRVSPNTSLTSGLVVLSNPVIGVNSIIFTPSSNFSYIGFYAASVFSDTQITNFSVREVGQDWTLATGWSIGDDKAICDGTSGNLYQVGTVTPNKQYKIEATVSNYVSGNAEVSAGAVPRGRMSANGTYTFYQTASTTSNFFVISNSFNGSVTNLSIIEVTSDTNLPRINYDGFSYDGSGNIIPNSGCGSWLWEGQSTNLITYSEDLSTYTTVSTTVSTTTEKSPIKSVTPFLITEMAVTNQHYIGGNSISLSGNNTLSCFVKNVSLGRYFKMWGVGLGGINEAVIFDTNTETIYEPPTTTVYVGGSAKLEDYGNGWFRCSITINITTTSFLAVGLINTVTGFGNNTYLGDITKSVLITGIQVEQQSYATSYIPTEGTTVTRNRDLCTNGGSSALINSTQGVLYFEGAALADDGTNRFLSINDGTVSNYIYFRYVSTSNQVLMRTQIGGVTINTIATFLTDTTLNNKFALKWKSGDYAFWVNGVKVGTDTSTTIFTANTLNLIEYSFPTDGGDGFPSKTKDLQIFKTALTDTELATLTTL